MSPSPYFLSPWTPDLSSTPYDVEDNNGPFSGQVTHAVQQWPLSCRRTGPLACCCSCRASPPSHISQMLSTPIKPMNWNRIGRRTSNVMLSCITYYNQNRYWSILGKDSYSTTP
ncbi:conserved hypothetical protein [Coccidioides posadasii str. Silveira]|uniref:Uncharacterized protein n=2 Tax=Coccidioides posadasii TaxID=199306 RepID=E9D5L4_COCPS|nr:conserved hypothetical protein [Coccidioides posadasii str. Silveira]KMM66401.1 hypothetical protein CPAG_02740 [Coccidioides posadasii RMSCC 3488]